MIIIGHKAIAYPKFQEIFELNDIDIANNATLIWFKKENDKEHILSQHCSQNNIKFAVYLNNITDFMIYAALKPTYIILDEFPEVYQKIAETYLMDLKILYVIETEEEIEILAKIGVDGVIFRDILR